MSTVVTVIQVEIWLFLGGAAAIVGYLLLTGGIETGDLLSEKDGTQAFSPERLQLLIFTLGIALYYLLAVLENSHRGTLPEPRTELLWILGGSNAVYLGGKTYALLLRRSDQDSSQRTDTRKGG